MTTLWRWLKRLIFGVLFLLVAIAAGLYFISAPPETSDELLFVGGPIITMAGNQTPEALLVKNGKISALGSRAELEAKLSDTAIIIDLKGDALLPGLIEPHTHPIASALLGSAVDVSGFSHNSREEVMATLRKAIDGPQLTEWVVAFGWDPIMVADLTAPTLAELDELSPDRPLLILTQMMHDAYVNSAGLKAAGVTRDTPDPQGGHFLHDANGELSGTVREVSAINVLTQALPKPPAGLTALLVNNQLNRYAKAGYTSIGVLGAVGRSDDPIGLLENLSQRSTVRSVVWALPNQLTVTSKPTQGEKFSLRGVKFWMDGSPFAGGAAWQEPYENSELVRTRLELPENHSPALNQQPNVFEQQFSDYHQRGFSIAVHAQGERAIDTVLNAVERVISDVPATTQLHRIEHNALITPEQLARAKQLGVELSFFIDHLWFYGDRLPEIVGETRLQRYMPLSSAIEAGHKITFHGDHPATPIAPFRSLRTAVQRQSRNGGPTLGINETIPLNKALEAMTINAARQLGMEKEVGSLEVGKVADLVRLSANPLALHPNQLATIDVKQTWLAGQPTDTRKLSRSNLRLSLSTLWEIVSQKN